MIDLPSQHYGGQQAAADELNIEENGGTTVGGNNGIVNSMQLLPSGHQTSGMTQQQRCGVCCQPICDRYLLKVGDICYHEACLQCLSCSENLRTTCFMRDGKIFCRGDYERLFVKNRCLSCGEKISSDEFVMRASAENVFHLKCFVCVVCGSRLQKGDQYVIKQSQLFCRPDYEKEVEMMSFTYEEYSDEIFQSRIDGRRGPKRPRTILTTQQRRAFKASFDITPKPCRKIRENLAKDTGLSIRIVQVWFQNQRAKVKKIQKKQAKEGMKIKVEQTDAEDSSENESKSPSKGKGDSPRSSNTYLPDSCSDNEGGGNSNGGGCGGNISGGNGNPMAFRHHQQHEVKREIDNLENDEEFFGIVNQQRSERDFMDVKPNAINFPPQQFIGLPVDYLGNPHQQQQQQQHQPSHTILNPIDRLYSMQNSYFCSPANENMNPLDPHFGGHVLSEH